MRGMSKDVINTVFTLVFAIGVIFGLYAFGTQIFERGAKVIISAFEEGGCACVDAVANAEIICGGQKVICNPCEKGEILLPGAKIPTFGCLDKQKIENFENILPYAVKKIRVCTHSDGNPSILVDEILKGKIESGNDKCTDIDFSSPEKIKTVEVVAGVGKRTDRLAVIWEKTEATQR